MSKKEPIYILNNVSKIFQDKNSRTVAVDDVSFEIDDIIMDPELVDPKKTKIIVR